MKTLTLTIILTTNVIISFGQNLISNSSFEDGSMNPNCQFWYDFCGNEITYLCDSVPSCQVYLYNQSPSPIPEEVWSLELLASMFSEGLAETYITGQNGTNIYQLKYWMKSPGWFGSGSIGTVSQKQFTATKTITDTTLLWKEYTLIDTITTLYTDTIAVRLSAGIGDFCVCTSYFDLIELIITGTVSLFENIDQFANYDIKGYPNPSSENIAIEIIDNQNEINLLSLYNSIGQSIKTIQSNQNIFSIDSKDIVNGLYFYQIQNTTDKKIIWHGKFVKN